jgi:cytochrome P450
VSVTWALYLLTQYPHIHRRLVAELDGVLAGAVPTAEWVERLPYLNLFVCESLRYLPSVPFILRQAV